MKSPSFEVAQKVGTIVLGQIVVDEVCNKYRENLEEKATKTRKAILELNDPLLTPHIVWRELDISDECSKYKDFLEMFIIESGMTVAEPYPKGVHEFIVQRDLQCNQSRLLRLMILTITIARIVRTKGVDMFATTGTLVEMFPHTDGILDMFPHTADIHNTGKMVLSLPAGVACR